MSGLPLPALVSTGVETQNGIRETVDERKVMQHAEDGARAAAGFLLEECEDSGGESGIKMGDRFVGQNELRLLDQRAGERDPLLFATGKPADQPVAGGAEIECVEAMSGEGAFMGRETGKRSPPWMPWKRAGEDVLESGGIAGEVELLEDESNATPVGAGLVQTSVLATIGDRTRAVRAHPSQGLEQCGFAGAGRTHDRHELSAGNRQIEIADQDPTAAFHGQALDPEMGRFDGGGGWMTRDQGKPE
jgi:hypothetical protein